MDRLKEAGISIGDFAESLINEGAIDASPSAPVAAPNEPPQKDIRGIKVPDSTVGSILTEAFGINHKPQTTPSVHQVPINERAITLREELKETVLKLTSLVTEMLNMTTTQAIGVNMAPTKKNRVAKAIKDSSKKKRTK